MKPEAEVIFMNRCIELALKGIGHVAPNPMVGSVIVHEDRIIGEGFHKMYGEAHAEVNAINSVEDKDLLPFSTLYVNLEPCSHYGKTPPCADLIIDKKIPRVVIGMQDPFSAVNGSGIKKLKAAGIEVTIPVEENACRELNKRFITFHQFHRPYCILKWAQSADHFVGVKGKTISISNDLSKRYSHQWRSEEQAILVGANTALTDNPQLNNRLWSGKSPVRILLDRSGKTANNNDLHLFNGMQETIVFTSNPKAIYQNATVKLIEKEAEFIPEVMHQLYQMGIQSVIVEGGPAIQNEIINLGIWDEARVFTSELKLEEGIFAPKLKMLPVENFSIGNNMLSTYKNQERK